jgi:predicted DNA-binding transcriptional regulator YafY
MSQPGKVPHYVRRFARLPQVLDLLTEYPNGLPLDGLAARVGAPVAELREDLLAFYTADLGPFGLVRAWVLEFLNPGGDEAEPNEAEVVRVTSDKGPDELGVHYVSAGELALLFTAGRLLQELEPGDAHLASALDVLSETVFGEVTTSQPTDGRGRNDALEPIRNAIGDHRRVRIVYSRAWRTGVGERVIEPYRLVNTRRGWEVDAGPLDDLGAIRTYLLSNIGKAELLRETFEVPGDLEAVLAQQRATSTVRVRAPQSERWAAELYAEKVRVVADDEMSATMDLDLLPPLEHRVGLLVVAAGPQAEVLDPPALRSAGAQLALELLEHHRRTGNLWAG